MSIIEDPHGRRVPAVERAVRLMDALASAHAPKSLADLARELALPRSSVHGLLATLAALGLARREGDGRFALGTRPLQWADAYAAQSDVLRAFEAQVGEHAALRSETVMLAVLEATEVTYLACRQGSRPLAVNFRVGGRFPAACTSSGKAILATLPEDTVQTLYADHAPQPLTRHSLRSTQALMRQLAQFRRQGYAVDDEETAEGMHCLGAPVFASRRPQAVAAVAVSAIKAAVTATRRAELIAAIRALAREMSERLGARPAAPPGP